MSDDCVFCRIVSGELPCYKVFEDSELMAFLDANPVNPGHLLVIPKKHYKTITDMPRELHGRLYELVWSLAYDLQKKLDPDGLRVSQSNNEAAGQLVPHFHVHMIPRYEGDEVFYQELIKPRKLSSSEMKRIQAKLKL